MWDKFWASIKDLFAYKHPAACKDCEVYRTEQRQAVQANREASRLLEEAIAQMEPVGGPVAK
jgi:hypothetical protein